jgi:hypothetical protein
VQKPKPSDPLQYLTESEKVKVEQAFSDPNMGEVIGLVQKGRWMELFKDASEELCYVLMAAHKQAKINENDLATALMFARVALTSKAFRIVKVETELEKIRNLTQIQQDALMAVVEDCKPNQQYMILMRMDSLDPCTEDLMSRNFWGTSHRFGYVNTDREGGILAFEPLKRHYKELTPVVHLTPGFDEFEQHVREKRSDFVLFLPHEKVPVHGSLDSTIWAPLHDLLHAQARRDSGDKLIPLIDLAREKFKGLVEVRSAYLKKLNDGIDDLFPHFKEVPTPLEMAAYVLDRVRGEIVDGGFRTSSNVNDTLKDLTTRVLRKEKQRVRKEHFENPAFKIKDAELNDLLNEVQSVVESHLKMGSLGYVE